MNLLDNDREILLRTRFTTAMVITLMSALVAAGLILAWIFFQQTAASHTENARLQLNVASETVTAAVSFGDGEAIKEALNAFDTGSMHDSAAVYSAKGELLQQLVALGEKPFPSKLVDLQDKQDWLERTITQQGPLMLPNAQAPTDASLGTLIVRANRQELLAALQHSLLLLGAILIIALIAGSLIAQRFSISALQSVNALTAWARRVSSSEDFSEPAPRVREVEVARLMESFETLISRISESNRELRRSKHELELTNAHLETLAYTDPLTGLPNNVAFRAHLNEAMDNACKTGEVVGLYLIDLHSLNTVIDDEGRSYSDAALRAVASRLRRALRVDDYFARLNGDQFAVVTECDQSKQDAVRLAERLSVLLTLATPTDDWRHPLYATVGVALFPYDAVDAAQLMLKAKDAVLHAKRQKDSEKSFSIGNKEVIDLPIENDQG